MCQKGSNQNVDLKRLAEKGVSTEDLLMTYKSRVRIHLELNIPLWHFTISNTLSNIIERVQKSCLFIILGKCATTDYNRNLAILDLEKLESRREEICIKFAKRMKKHPVHRNMFQWKENSNTRAVNKVIVAAAKTVRYDRSSIPSLARIINSM